MLIVRVFHLDCLTVHLPVEVSGGKWVEWDINPMTG